MARLNINQLRQWMNGDIINAQEYNQERNLIIEANNDTNEKSNLATLNAENALQQVTSLKLTGVPVSLGSVIRRLTLTLTEGQTVITLPVPYTPNVNRVQAYINGQLVAVQELNNTQIQLPASQPGARLDVQWFTEVPNIFEVDRLYTAIEDADVAIDAANDAAFTTRIIWKDPVTSVSQLPIAYPSPQHGWTVAIRQGSRIFRFENGQWRERIDLSYDMVNILSDLVDLADINGGMFGEANNLIPINGGSF